MEAFRTTGRDEREAFRTTGRDEREALRTTGRDEREAFRTTGWGAEERAAVAGSDRPVAVCVGKARGELDAQRKPSPASCRQDQAPSELAEPAKKNKPARAPTSTGEQPPPPPTQPTVAVH